MVVEMENCKAELLDLSLEVNSVEMSAEMKEYLSVGS
jgi:hypothetical protein